MGGGVGESSLSYSVVVFLNYYYFYFCWELYCRVPWLLRLWRILQGNTQVGSLEAPLHRVSSCPTLLLPAAQHYHQLHIESQVPFPDLK